jgi:hypothetical protein
MRTIHTTMQIPMPMPISCGVCHATANDLVRLGELGVVCLDCLSDAYQATAALMAMGYQSPAPRVTLYPARTSPLFLVKT